MRVLIAAFSFLLLAACKEETTSVAQTTPKPSIISQGNTIKDRFATPSNYARTATDGFGAYLRNLPLKPEGSLVKYYNGDVKDKPGVYAAVVNMDIGHKDLQQCADAVMRLRAEYLYAAKEYDKIHFRFTNGFNAAYSNWRAGQRIKLKGNTVSWYQAGSANNSYESFRQYLQTVFSYAGTLSLSRELKTVPYKDMQVGDVLIKGGSPGHAVIVVDIVENKQGQKMYMLAQSYMPAQETQVLLNPMSDTPTVWYKLDKDNASITTPEWRFSTSDLKRFSDE